MKSKSKGPAAAKKPRRRKAPRPSRPPKKAPAKASAAAAVPDRAGTIKLGKFLARHGGVSRRRAAELVSRGEVFLSGRRAGSPGILIDPRKDKPRIKGRELKAAGPPPVYLMLNKPEKTLTTASDPKGRPTVMDIVGRRKARVFPVGRLDWDSEGLLLLTNDGEFAQKILHPKNRTAKTYMVKIQGRTSPSQRAKLLRGMSLPAGRAKALYAKPLPPAKASSQWLKVIISEGKNRQIRMMFQKMGFRVSRLRRTAIGRLKLKKLPKGGLVRLKKEEAEKALLRPKEIS